MKSKFHYWQKFELWKLFIVQKYTQNANGDVFLNCGFVHSLSNIFWFYGDNVNELR